MKFNIRVFVLIALTVGAEFLHGSGLPANRGTQLFLLIREQNGLTYVIAMKPRRRLLQEWNRCTGTYDFVSAVVRRTRDGSRVSFTRYVMKDDYTPRIQRLDLTFPYSVQAHYQFFDVGSTVGFSRNSPDDIDARELFGLQHK